MATPKGPMPQHKEVAMGLNPTVRVSGPSSTSESEARPAPKSTRRTK